MKLTPMPFLFLATVSIAYVLDDSCSEYEDMITAGMKGAFEMAQASSDILNSPSSDKNAAKAQQDLISYMFQSISSDASKKNEVKDRFTGVLNFNINSGNPENTLNADKNKADYLQLKSDNIILFCNYDRFAPDDHKCDGTTEQGFVCDQIMQYDETLNPPFLGCRSGLTTYYAWTNPISASNAQAKATVIQLCPWYLKLMNSLEYKNWGDLGPKSLQAFATEMFDQQAYSIDAGHTPMDAVRLFDNSMLHELTHAVHNTGPIDDIEEGGVPAYGWQACKYWNGQSNIDNADNYAFFGLGAKMISPTNNLPAERPMSDGSIQLLSAAQKRDAITYAPLQLLNRDSNNTSPTNNTDIQKQQSLLKAVEAETTAVHVSWSSNEVDTASSFTFSTSINTTQLSSSMTSTALSTSASRVWKSTQYATTTIWTTITTRKP